MQGIAAQTDMSGSAWLPFTKKLAIGARKNICIRYMLNESREMPVNHRGASFGWCLYAGLKSLGMNTLHVLFQLGC